MIRSCMEDVTLQVTGMELGGGGLVPCYREMERCGGRRWVVRLRFSRDGVIVWMLDEGQGYRYIRL